MKERVEEVEKKMDSDWRLTNQMNYMYRATLRKCSFHKTPNNDHKLMGFIPNYLWKNNPLYIWN